MSIPTAQSAPTPRLYDALLARGISRRAFLRFSVAVTAALALPASFTPRIVEALERAPRLPVIWLRGQSCGGETASFLRSASPSIGALLVDTLSMEYDETLMAASGASAQRALMESMLGSSGSYLAVVEGSIPTGAGDAFSIVGGRPFSQVVRDVCAGAMATFAVGACAVDGGIPAAHGGASEAKGVSGVVTEGKVLNLPGCPVNVENLAAAIVHLVTFNALPPADPKGRPLFAYASLVHNQCERRSHFEFGEFATSWGDEGAQKGWCLYKLGCKGPETFSNCPTVRWGQKASWPIAAGHGCIGCTMPGFWDAMGPAYDRLPAPVAFAPEITADQIGVGLVGAVGGAAVLHAAGSVMRDRRVRAIEAREAAEAAGIQAPSVSAVSESPEVRGAAGPVVAPEPAVAPEPPAAPEPSVAPETVKPPETTEVE